MSRSTAGPKGSDAYLQRLAIDQILAHLGNIDTSLVAGGAVPHVHGRVFQAFLARGNPERHPDQVGVGELLPGPQVAVVQEDLEPGRVESGGRLLADLLRALQHHEMDVVRRDRERPDDPVLVVVLLDHRSNRALEADPVRAHDERLLLAVLVDERRLERRGVTRAELEDVADLDRRRERERATAVRAGVALARGAQVGEARLEVAPGLGAAQVPAVAVRTGDVLPLAQRLVRDNRPLESDGAERAAGRAERGSDLVVRGRTGRRAERGV